MPVLPAAGQAKAAFLAVPVSTVPVIIGFIVPYDLRPDDARAAAIVVKKPALGCGDAADEMDVRLVTAIGKNTSSRGQLESVTSECRSAIEVLASEVGLDSHAMRRLDHRVRPTSIVSWATTEFSDLANAVANVTLAEILATIVGRPLPTSVSASCVRYGRTAGFKGCRQTSLNRARLAALPGAVELAGE